MTKEARTYNREKTDSSINCAEKTGQLQEKKDQTGLSQII